MEPLKSFVKVVTRTMRHRMWSRKMMQKLEEHLGLTEFICVSEAQGGPSIQAEEQALR